MYIVHYLYYGPLLKLLFICHPHYTLYSIMQWWHFSETQKYIVNKYISLPTMFSVLIYKYTFKPICILWTNSTNYLSSQGNIKDKNMRNAPLISQSQILISTENSSTNTDTSK